MAATGHLKIDRTLVASDNALVLKSATAPLSGTSGTGAGVWAAPGVLLRCTGNKVTYINEGTLASPYWTPVSFDQAGLLAWATDFRDGLGKAHADTAGTATLVGSGIRVHGQGIAETDSGLVVTIGEGGPVAALTTTDEAAHLAALSVGGTTPPFQPDTHGPLVIDATVTMDTAITLRSLFIGFLGSIADALDPPVTGNATTLTLVQDDLAGLVFDAGLTDADGLFAPHNKSDEAATILTTATGVDCSTAFPAAATYQRLRVEMSAAGVMTCFADKVQITSIAAALDVDEEVAPCLLARSTSAAVKTMNITRFATWGSRA